MKRIILVFFLIIAGRILFAQDPYSFTLGSEELSGVHIYDLHYSSQDVLYIGTNEGLFLFKNGQFKHYKSAYNQYGNAAFGVKETSNGDVYFHNMSGQVMRLSNESISVFAELKPETIGSVIVSNLLNDSTIIYTSKSLVYLDLRNGKQEVLKDLIGNVFSGPGVDVNKEIKLPVSSRGDSILTLSGTSRELSIDSLIPNLESNDQVIQMGFMLKGSLFFFVSNGNIYDYTNRRWIKNFVPPDQMMIQIDENEVAFLNVKGGVTLVKMDEQGDLIKEPFFSDVFISSITKNDEDTYFLGTFDSGVIVIVNKNLKKPLPKFLDHKASGVFLDEEQQCFFSATNGGVYIYKDGLNKLDMVDGIRMDRIFGLNGFNFWINERYPHLLYPSKKIKSNEKNPYGSVSDLCKVDEHNVLLATSIGLVKLSTQNISDKPIIEKIEDESRKDRGRVVVYDSINQLIYFGTDRFLESIQNDGKREQLKYRGKQIKVITADISNDTVYLGTYDNGILIYRNAECIDQINDKDGLAGNFVRKIKVVDQKLFIATKKMMQIFDLKNQNWKSIGRAEGIQVESINDFDVDHDRLWIISGGTALMINWRDLENKEPKLDLYLDSVLVRGNSVNLDVEGDFKHYDNEFSFFFDYRNIKYGGEVVLNYKLEGFDKEWKSLEGSLKQVDYSYLPPGNYVFKIKAVYRGVKGKTKTYTFSIAKPFYNQWWFYVSIFILLSLGISTYFVIRIRRIRKNNFEILEKQKLLTSMLDSKLKALRSQMNPHFIFNSLNSIQALILKQDTVKSYDYVVLFSDLVRKTLSYSEEDFIDIEEEIEFLKIYLSLESLRMKDSFKYEVEYDGDCSVELPSLIIQPFIENAIHHGLLHKEGMKILKIKFEFSDELKCIITDNGIGREKAQEIKERQLTQHLSFSLKATKQRMSILEEQYGTKAGYELIDLYSDGKPSGTKVIISLPFISNE